MYGDGPLGRITASVCFKHGSDSYRRLSFFGSSSYFHFDSEIFITTKKAFVKAIKKWREKRKAFVEQPPQKIWAHLFSRKTGGALLRWKVEMEIHQRTTKCIIYIYQGLSAMQIHHVNVGYGFPPIQFQ